MPDFFVFFFLRLFFVAGRSRLFFSLSVDGFKKLKHEA